MPTACIRYQPEEDTWGTLEYKGFWSGSHAAGTVLAFMVALPGTSFPIEDLTASANLAIEVADGIGSRAITGTRAAPDSAVAEETMGTGIVGGYPVWSTGCVFCVRAHRSHSSHGVEGFVGFLPFSCHPNSLTHGFSGPAGPWRFATAGAGDLATGAPFLVVTAPVGDAWQLFARSAEPRPIRPCQGLIGYVVFNGEPFPPQ